MGFLNEKRCKRQKYYICVKYIMFSFLNKNESLNCAYQVNQDSIPKSSLGYKTNNQYQVFPPKMSDGRAIIASYQPEAVLNNQILKESGIKTNWEYRNYLTQNAKAIMTRDFQESSNDCGYYVRYGEPQATSGAMNGSSPYLYSSYTDNTPVMGVYNSDLKQLYLTREQLNSRKISPVVTQAELLNIRKVSN